MQLYEIYSLADKRYPKDGYYGYLTAPSVEKVEELLKTNYLWQHYKKKGSIIDIRFYSLPYDSHKGTHIKLQMEWIPKKESTSISIPLVEVTIHSVENNCSAVHISNFKSNFRRLRLGSLLLQYVEEWCIQVGYTIIFGNTAGNFQNTEALPFFLKNGYTPMGQEYVNVRTRNKNIWFQKIINTEIPEDEEYDEEYEEYDEEDEDN